MTKSNKVADRPSKTAYIYPPLMDCLEKHLQKTKQKFSPYVNSLIEADMIAKNQYLDLDLINWKVDDESGNCWFEYYIGEDRQHKTLTLSEITEYADWKGWLIRYDIDRESYEITGLEYALFDLATNWHDAEQLIRHYINKDNHERETI